MAEWQGDAARVRGTGVPPVCACPTKPWRSRGMGVSPMSRRAAPAFGVRRLRRRFGFRPALRRGVSRASSFAKATEDGSCPRGSRPSWPRRRRPGPRPPLPGLARWRPAIPGLAVRLRLTAAPWATDDRPCGPGGGPALDPCRCSQAARGSARTHASASGSMAPDLGGRRPFGVRRLRRRFGFRLPARVGSRRVPGPDGPSPHASASGSMAPDFGGRRAFGVRRLRRRFGFRLASGLGVSRASSFAKATEDGACPRGGRAAQSEADGV